MPPRPPLFKVFSCCEMFVGWLQLVSTPPPRGTLCLSSTYARFSPSRPAVVCSAASPMSHADCLYGRFFPNWKHLDPGEGEFLIVPRSNEYNYHRACVSLWRVRLYCSPQNGWTFSWWSDGQQATWRSAHYTHSAHCTHSRCSLRPSAASTCPCFSTFSQLLWNWKLVISNNQ